MKSFTAPLYEDPLIRPFYKTSPHEHRDHFSFYLARLSQAFTSIYD